MIIDKDKKCFGVIDPRSERLQEWLEQFGGDSVPLNSARVWTIGLGTYLRLDVVGLGPAGLIRACRHVARRQGQSYHLVYSDAIQGSGLILESKDVRVCRNPREGRYFWACRNGGEGGSCEQVG